ncbi:MAG: GNAT family N-acetyltransferase [Pseudomonadales bacterium]
MQIHVVPVSWSEREADLRGIRHTVFVIEQNVPEELEWDEQDPPGEHFIALDSTGQILGCARLTTAGQIGRMAVLAEHRGRGIGAALLEAAVESAARKQLSEVFLHAQTHAEGFYRQAGFVREGAEYLEAGIEHINMRAILPLTYTQTAVAQTAASRPSRPASLPAGPDHKSPEQLTTPRSFVDEAGAIAALTDSLAEPARKLSLLSPDLDHHLFDIDSVAAAVSRFARSAPGCELRILIYSSRLVVARGHRLLELMRRLDSKISIRKVPSEYAKDERSFVVWDQQGYWLLPNADDYQGLATAADPVMATRLQERFDYLWERSRTDPDLRSLKL